MSKVLPHELEAEKIVKDLIKTNYVLKVKSVSKGLKPEHVQRIRSLILKHAERNGGEGFGIREDVQQVLIALSHLEDNLKVEQIKVVEINKEFVPLDPVAMRLALSSTPVTSPRSHLFGNLRRTDAE